MAFNDFGYYAKIVVLITSSGNSHCSKKREGNWWGREGKSANFIEKMFKFRDQVGFTRLLQAKSWWYRDNSSNTYFTVGEIKCIKQFRFLPPLELLSARDPWVSSTDFVAGVAQAISWRNSKDVYALRVRTQTLGRFMNNLLWLSCL